MRGLNSRCTGLLKENITVRRYENPSHRIKTNIITLKIVIKAPKEETLFQA